jgi:hypothetical protein
MLAACKEKTNDSIMFLNLSKSIRNQFMLSDISKTITYVKLDTALFINFILSLNVTEKNIFVGSNPSGLSVFDINGNFVNKIGKIGYGPGEYKYGNDFAFDSSEQIVYVLDNKSILVYSIKNQYLRKISLEKLNGNFRQIQFQNGNILLFEGITSGYGKYNWVVIDTLGNIICEKLNHIPPFVCTIGFRNDVSYFYNGIIHYWDSFNDTIFSIKENNPFPKFVFENYPERLPLHDITWDQYENKYIDIRRILESHNYLYLFYFFKQSYFTLVYCKKSMLIYTVGHSDDEDKRFCGPGIINDIDSGLGFAPYQYFQLGKDEYLVSWAFAYQIKAHVASDAFKNSTPKYPEKKKELERLANSLSENDNPVLMIVKLKE